MPNLILLISFLVLIAIVSFFSLLKVKNYEDFMLASRKVPFLFLSSTLFASFITTKQLFDNVENVFQYGIIYIITYILFAIREILVATFVAPRIENHSDCFSIGDILEKNWGISVKIFSGVGSFFLCIIIATLQISMLAFLLDVFFDVPFFYSVIISSVVIIFYLVIGGFYSISIMHLIYFFFIIMILPIIIKSGIYQTNGWGNILSTLPNRYFDVMYSISLPTFFSLLFSILLLESFLPPYIQRLLSAKNNITLRISIVVSGIIFPLFFLGTGIIAFIIYALFPIIDPNEATLHLIFRLLPDFSLIIVSLGLIALVLSSIDSFLNSAVLVFTNDILKPIFKDSEILHSMILVRIFTLLIGILPIYFVYNLSIFHDIFIYFLQIWAPIMVIPILISIFEIKLDKKDFFYSIFFSMFIFLIMTFGFDGFLTEYALLTVFTFNALVFLYFVLKRKFFPKKESLN
jgi:solute:Na+ symporter, SSS family